MHIQYIEGTNLAYCDGYKFRKDSKSGYWLCTTLQKRLHRYVWEQINGEIPVGFDIHHQDGNKDNNNISNLVLMDKKEHKQYHVDNITQERREDMRNNMLEKAIPAAKEWHKSEAGKQWHKEHYEKMKDKMHVERNFVCVHCGKPFTSTGATSKFCSNKCKSAYRRKIGKDNVTRTCIVCGKEFNTNKYRQNVTCGKTCFNKYFNLQ